MTSRRRNLFIILLVLGLLAASAVVIAERPTRLGLDLKGGVELVYEGRPTPKVPEVTPQAIDDAIETIRKRTDALGVSEPEIQRAGAAQISIGLPDVANAERAIRQVGTTAQLQYYDWEPNIFGDPNRPIPSLYEAAKTAARSKPRAEVVDIPPGAPPPAVRQRFQNDPERLQQHYDRRNDTAQDKYYLFAPGAATTRPLLAGPEPTCKELAETFEDDAAPRGGARPGAKVAGPCASELGALPAPPPPGSEVVRVPQGILVIRAERPRGLAEDKPFNQYYVLEDDSELSGSDIKNPEQNTDPQTNEPVVSFQFTDGGKKFAAVTKRIAERGAEQILPPGTPREEAFQRFAIVLDNEVISLATIDFVQYPEGIDGRTGAQINGIGSLQETQDLAENLRIGALPIDLKLISQTQVSATLGKQALDQGLLAAAAGLVLTLLFLVSFYRVLGAIAGVALLTYAVLLFALVKLIPITLTLPGIAGLILTLGVAADANIVIFERIKEEVRAGRSIPAAISGGYAKALRTIIDANVVTIGVAFILFVLATAGVKGFAFTLGVGTLVSLFTAVLATSAALGTVSRTRLLRSRFALGAGTEGRPWRFDFMGKSKWFFSTSGVILVAGALAIAGLGINFGIDFESGTRIKTPLERPASVDQVREALPPQFRDSEVQEVEEPELGPNVFQISTPTLQPAEVTRVQESLDDAFGVDRADFSTSSIGPTFGAQIANTALIAIIASLALISIYIGLRFEFKFAVPVLIALAHDILITAGVYSLTEREVTTSTVAALLTILGYSLYDTIIVFDRIRENVPRMPRATFSQIVNRSMAEVLTRSLVTSLCTLLPVSALLLFGGETLRDFAFALLVGVASGTYSSIFIASPVLTAWKEREPVYRRRRQVVMEDHGGLVPAFAETSLGAAQPDREPVPAVAGATRSPRRRRAAATGSPARTTAGDGRGAARAGDGREVRGDGSASSSTAPAEPAAPRAAPPEVRAGDGADAGPVGEPEARGGDGADAPPADGPEASPVGGGQRAGRKPGRGGGKANRRRRKHGRR